MEFLKYFNRVQQGRFTLKTRFLLFKYVDTFLGTKLSAQVSYPASAGLSEISQLRIEN